MVARRESLDVEEAEARAALAAAAAVVPEAHRGPTQFLGRHHAGCAATIGAMPRCDFACTGCYLGADANRARPSPLAELEAQLRTIRAWLGPAGNVQLTDGEVTLRNEAELVHLIAYARGIGLVPMLMTHGETFRRRPGLLERLMERGGLSEISVHIDTTQRGRRDRFAGARTERELDPLREEFAELVRTARRRTGLRLEAASTVTVTRDNLADVAGTTRWFLGRADAFKMVSFQPLAEVGRTERALRGVAPDELWERIAEGLGLSDAARSTGTFGHSACSRFLQGLAANGGGRARFVPLYRRDRPGEMRALHGWLDRVGGSSFRLDDTPRALRRAGRFAFRHGGFFLVAILPRLLRLRWRAGFARTRYFCVVSHHFMSAAETATPTGRERLAACAFRVPIEGRMEPMCAVNALGLREAVYRRNTEVGAAAPR